MSPIKARYAGAILLGTTVGLATVVVYIFLAFMIVHGFFSSILFQN